MSGIATQRLKREMKDLTAAQMFKIELVDNSLYHMKAIITGPPDTAYAKGSFKLDIKICERYPFSPPTVKFITRIWHPNISSVTGVICLDILKSKWEATLTIRSILISLQVLLQDPQPNDPQDAVVARQYLSNFEEFKRTAAYWTAVYATHTPEERLKFADYEARLQKLRSIIGEGIPEHKLISALSGNAWNVEKALESLT